MQRSIYLTSNSIIVLKAAQSADRYEKCLLPHVQCERRADVGALSVLRLMEKRTLSVLRFFFRFFF